MKIKTKNKLSTIFKIIATISIIPLIFSTFFSGYNVISSGTQVNEPVSVSIFEFSSKNETLLTLSFVAIVLEILTIVCITFLGMGQTIKHKQDKFIGIVLSVCEILISLIPIILVGVFCNMKTEVGLKYVMGVCPIIYCISGILFGGLMILSYIIYEQPKQKKTKVSQPKPQPENVLDEQEEITKIK